MPSDRIVRTRWTGGMRAVTEAGAFEVVVDEPAESGGTDTGPQPTDLLLASLSSCLTLAFVYAARKRDLELPGLRVVATGIYDGPRFVRIALVVESDGARSVLEALAPAAERMCYVSNTLRRSPELTVVVG